ncbi:hypothetical protein EWM64_g10855 [Hericium alpestre]|uniref:Uncharacterized protein n=1 Tax=Hericium alpestre TaxID=135208 RepID=A0A4Y9ZEC5_9AGAM|nr:hypothetical protein EWM64_g10855 [Hericium alpestre]
MFSTRKMKEMFNEYQDSITMAIAQNTTGENWLQHAHLVYYKSHSVLLPDETVTVNLSFFELSTTRNTVLPALVVKDATDIFAERHVDGKLTEAQAFVVQRMLLHLWLYQALFGKPWNRMFL